MGPQDATNLLVAVASSEFVKDSVRNVERYGSLRADPASVSVHGGRHIPESALPLFDLPTDHAFAEALQRILALLGADDFFRDDVRSHFGAWRQVPHDAEYLFVRFFLPYDAVSVLYGLKRRYQVHRLYGSLPIADARAAWDLRSIDAEGRLLTLRVVDKHALLKIGKAIA